MRIRSYIWTSLIGSFVAAAVYYWPQFPLWSHPITAANALLQFAPEGKSLIVAEGMAENLAADQQSDLVAYDLRSGKELRRTHIPLPKETFMHRLYLAEDLNALVTVTAPVGANGTHGWPSSLSTYDARNGQRLNGPMVMEQTEGLQVSRNGKWLCYVEMTGSGSQDYRAAIQIISTADLHSAHALPFDHSREVFHEFCFSQDETKLIILSTKWPGIPLLQMTSPPSLSNLLRVFDLSAGKITQSIDLPASLRWTKVVKATTDQIYLECMELSPVAPQKLREEICAVSFDKKGNRVEPLFESITHTGQTERVCESFGEDWLLHREQSHDQTPNRWKETLMWFDEKCGTTMAKRFDRAWGISVTDRSTGKTRFETSSRELPCLLMRSDGQYLAMTFYRELGLEMWDARPSARWYYAVVAGVLPLLCVLAIRQRNRHRSKRSMIV